MKILVTAGNTHVPVDQVRAITNVFTGRTGSRIALEAYRRGHTVRLLTSHPELISELEGPGPPRDGRWNITSYRTFDELHDLMAAAVGQHDLGAVIHSAAVSDYRVKDTYISAPWALAGLFFRMTQRYLTAEGVPGWFQKVSAPKLKSSHDVLWLRLEPTPKLVDMIREAWSFLGILVKFKLEVGISDEELLTIAEQSRQQSKADLMVANTLENKDAWAYLGPSQGTFQKIDRAALATRLLDAVEDLHRQRAGG